MLSGAFLARDYRQQLSSTFTRSFSPTATISNRSLTLSSQMPLSRKLLATWQANALVPACTFISPCTSISSVRPTPRHSTMYPGMAASSLVSAEKTVRARWGIRSLPSRAWLARARTSCWFCRTQSMAWVVSLKLTSSTSMACSRERTDFLAMIRLTQCSNISPVQNPTSAKAWMTHGQQSLLPKRHSHCCSCSTPRKRSMTRLPSTTKAKGTSALASSRTVRRWSGVRKAHGLLAMCRRMASSSSRRRSWRARSMREASCSFRMLLRNSCNLF